MSCCCFKLRFTLGEESCPCSIIRCCRSYRALLLRLIVSHFLDYMLDFKRQEVNQRHDWDYLARFLFNYALIDAVPFCLLEMKTVNYNSIVWCFNQAELFFELGLDYELKFEKVDGFLMFTSIGLQNTCHKAVWEEETTQPICRRVPICHPFLNEGHSFHELGEPYCKVLIRSVRDVHPVLRNLIL